MNIMCEPLELCVGTGYISFLKTVFIGFLTVGISSLGLYIDNVIPEKVEGMVSRIFRYTGSILFNAGIFSLILWLTIGQVVFADLTLPETLISVIINMTVLFLLSISVRGYN